MKPSVRLDGITIREFAEGDEATLFEIFRSAVHLVACEDYDSDQLDAWAPADYDAEQWRRRIRAIQPFFARFGFVVTERRAPRRRGVVIPTARMRRRAAVPGTEGYAEQAGEPIFRAHPS